MTTHRRLRLGAAAAIAIGLTGAGTTAPSAAATPDLAGLWLFNESSGQTARDASGSGNNGMLGSTAGADANDPTRVSLGPLGLRGALRFDGDDYVTVRNAPALEPDGVTVAARVRSSVAPGAHRYVAAKGAIACQIGSYGLYTGAGGTMQFYVSDGWNYTLSPAAAGNLWDGAWHTVVGAYDGSNVTLWVDGAKVGSTSANVTIGYGLPDADALSIGDYRGPCPESLGFVGDIDGVALVGRYTTNAGAGLAG